MNQGQLLDDLTQAFNEVELQELCFRLGINYDHLPGSSLVAKARELIQFSNRRGRLRELVQAVVAERPNLAENYREIERPDEDLSWLDRVAAGEGEPISEPPTSTWPIDEAATDLSWLEEIAGERGAVIEEPPTWKWPSEVYGHLVPEPTTGELPTHEVSRHALPTNPYNAGPMVTDRGMFFGRVDERRRLLARMQNMGSSSIVGMRRLGKSSLLYYLSHHEAMPDEPRFLLAHLDLQDNRFHTLPGLLNHALHRWYAQMGRTPAPTVTGLTGFARQLEALVAQGFQPVLCLDEFENLTKRPAEFGDDVFEGWRALGNSGQLAFITVSQRPLADLIKSEGLTSNFYNIFSQVDLGLLTEEEARSLLIEPAARQGIEVPPAAVDYLLSLCGPHPFYLQMAAFHLLDGLLVNRYSLEQVHENFSREAEYHWRGLWRALSPAHQSLLAAPLQVDAPLVVARQYRVLARLGLLVAQGEGYRLFSQGFADWLKEQGQVEAEASGPTQTADPEKPKLLGRLLNLLGKE